MQIVGIPALNYDDVKSRIRGSKDYGQVCSTGDIIDVYLDFNERTLSFSINNKDYGVAFDNIKTGDYRFGVTLTGKGTSLQLIAYECFEQIHNFCIINCFFCQSKFS